MSNDILIYINSRNENIVQKNEICLSIWNKSSENWKTIPNKSKFFY